jgi:hypothetical protein
VIYSQTIVESSGVTQIVNDKLVNGQVRLVHICHLA